MSSKNKRRRLLQRQSPLESQGNHADVQPEGRLVASQQQFSGPLPPPEMLKQYEEIHPGTAERVLQQFERETQHRQALEQKIIDAQMEAQRAEVPALRLGQVFAFAIAVVGILSSAYCIRTASTVGHAWAGASIGGLSLATLVGLFIYGRRSNPPTEDTEKKIT